MKMAGSVPTWPVLMQFGFGVLRLSSNDFWSLTLLELEAAMTAQLTSEPQMVSRSELDQMMRAHPDLNEEQT